MSSVCVITLGCRVNQYDSQVLRELGEAAGHRIEPDPASADWIVLNACTVTAAADADARRLLSRARRLNPRVRLAVVGCVPPGAETLGADLVLGCRDKFRVFERMRDNDEDPPPRHQVTKGSGILDRLNNTTSDMVVDPQGPGSHWPLPISRFDGRRRPILKVQDGCRFRCSYCIVPSRRGRSVSRPKSAILEEARRLAGAGAVEVVLAGVHLSSYGMDLGRKASEARLAPVVAALLRIPGIRRVRLSSYGVSDFEEGLLDLAGWEGGLCPHFHLPLQSGDAGVLRSMKRPYTPGGFRKVVARVRRRVPEAGITTDVIVGFPGETDKAFDKTMDLVRDLVFQNLHPFSFSSRPGTPAEMIKETVSSSVVRERVRKLAELKKGLRAAKAASLEGKERWVVAEVHDAICHAGTTAEGVRLVFPRESVPTGRWVQVRVGEFIRGQITARLVK